MASESASLLELSEELTCAICLGIFESPVSIPCGHNFCSFCLELTWESDRADGDWKCPQCRTSFPTKPALCKNTVLDAVVQQYLLSVNQKKPEGVSEEPEMPEEPEVPEEPEEESWPSGSVRCDSCARAAAAQTCLTCMVSFCQEHLRPHLESQAFSHHQLHSPLGPSELALRRCKDHCKLIEYFCQGHGQCLCCDCLLSHKACKTDTVPEAKRKREGFLCNLQLTLHDKIEKTCSAFDEVTTQEEKVKENIEMKKNILKQEFSEINDIIQLEEQKVMKAIEEEEKRVEGRFSFTHNILSKKKKEFENLMDRVEKLLNEDDEIIFLMLLPGFTRCCTSFLQKATKLNDVTSKDAFVPKIDCDQKLLHNISKDVYFLKEMLRNPKSPNDKTAPNLPGDPCGTAPANKVPLFERRTVDFREPRGPPPPPIPSLFKKIPKTNPVEKKKPSPREDVRRQPGPASDDAHEDTPTCLKGKRQKNKAKANPIPTNPATDLQTRDDLLKYAERLSLDYNTVHKRIVLTERSTKIAVSDAPQNYTDNPQRFTHCSQVLGYQGFARGIHYWEVEIKSGNFCGIGVSYKSIDRKGTESRLGRNKVSWCIEWFNGKLSAWHDDVEESLRISNPDKVGVLLNCNDGQIIFYSHANKIHVLYKFQAKFTEAVYPAFWVFSSQTTLALCPLT